jgi:hypothetical protein
LTNLAIGVEKFLRIRGILEPASGAFHGFDSLKEERENHFVVGSHYLQDKLESKNLEDLNKYLAETE